MSDVNPYESPVDDAIALTVQALGPYGGIGRLVYFGTSFVVSVISYVLQFITVGAGVPEAAFVLGWISLIINIVLVVKRLQNVGYSGWWVLGLIVPFLNILVAVWCIAAPEGYADHKQLDTAGKIIVGLFLAMTILVVGLVVMG